MTSPYLRQADFPAVWPDTGRPCPWADLSGTEAGRYYGWPVAHRSDIGDVWQVGPDRFVVKDSWHTSWELPTAALAVRHIENTAVP